MANRYPKLRTILSLIDPLAAIQIWVNNQKYAIGKAAHFNKNNDLLGMDMVKIRAIGIDKYAVYLQDNENKLGFG